MTYYTIEAELILKYERMEVIIFSLSAFLDRRCKILTAFAQTFTYYRTLCNANFQPRLRESRDAFSRETCFCSRREILSLDLINLFIQIALLVIFVKIGKYFEIDFYL